jgi:hypothetical protein
MWDWVTDNAITVVFFIGFVGALFYALRLRSKMASSKAHFALVVCATLTSCLIALLNFLSGSGPTQTGSKIISAMRYMTGTTQIASPREVGWLIAGLGTVGTVLAFFFIFRFSIHAIRNWDGPVTVNVNELAKRDQDDSLRLLALAELKRLITLKPDPPASDTAVNWRQRQREAPSAPSWHELSRSLFESAFEEAVFNDHSWRDRLQSWVGEMYVFRPGASETSPLVLFVFEQEPDRETIEARIKLFIADGVTLDGVYLFGVFNSGATERERSVVIGDYPIQIWPRRSLLIKGLKLSTYARDLVRRFDSDVLRGTRATLRDTFVSPHVHRSGSTDRELLSEVIYGWLDDPSRRHLAITGEYGQGKSTAMLELCVSWARSYLSGQSERQRIPLLIELRGQSPAEVDSISFLAPWASRYGLAPKQVYNLIRSGDAVVILEGFDELRNAGRAYDRHEHFNALWGMAFPGTKLIFTGRPNFFLDERERNRTLRSDVLDGASGSAFTQVWEMERLTLDEVGSALKGFGEALGQAILSAVQAHSLFFEIVSRPSMLPVVATIWGTIQNLQEQGYDLTSAILIEHYLQATYRRKEGEAKGYDTAGSDLANYLLLPREVRELFTLAIVWKMAANDARNTISRATFNSVISLIYEDVFVMFQEQGVPPEITQRIRGFEERFREETREDRVERVCNEIASAGLFVPDPAGGPSNLRLPHKQFYEYLIAKASWTILKYRESSTARKLETVSKKNPCIPLLSEQQSLTFFSELLETDFSMFNKYVMIFNFTIMKIIASLISAMQKISLRSVDRKMNMVYFTASYDFMLRRIDAQMRAVAALTSTSLVALPVAAIGYILAHRLVDVVTLPGARFYFLFLSFVTMIAVISVTPRILLSPMSRVLQAIVAIRLASAENYPRTDEFRLLSIYRECLLVLLAPKKSKVWIIPGQNPDPRAVPNVKKVGELIAPIS